VIVADGMGGHASGEVASKMAIDAMREFFEATAKDPDATWPYKMDKQRSYEENRLITAVKLANLRIFEAAQREPRYRGMGTTLVVCLAVREGIIVGHVGDSRVYRIRNGTIEQLTEDHSLLNDYLKMRKLTEEEIANFPHKNVIVRALGMKDSVKVDSKLDHPNPGDIYLLCSDGLSGRCPTRSSSASSRRTRTTSRPRPPGSSPAPTRTAGRTTSPPASSAGSARRTDRPAFPPHPRSSPTLPPSFQSSPRSGRKRTTGSPLHGPFVSPSPREPDAPQSLELQRPAPDATRNRRESQANATAPPVTFPVDAFSRPVKVRVPEGLKLL
jgi:hypothetical protein